MNKANGHPKKTTRHFECHTSACKHVNSKRTIDQNRAMHLWFQMVADELNNAGLPIKKTLENYKVDLDWDASSVKELMWRPIQKALLGKKSTADLKKTGEVDQVYEHINRFLGEQFGIHVPFPFDPQKLKEKQYLGADQIDNYPEAPEDLSTAFD